MSTPETTASTDSQPLKDKWIVITRPQHQVASLKQSLEQAGANVVLFPLLEIVPLKVDHGSAIQNYDMLIFVSPNAVQQALNLVTFSTLSKITIAAVGKKTAELLEKNGITATVCPEKIFNSEALLAMPELQSDMMIDKNVAIMRGEGGRNALKDTLEQRGANVTYINLYQRRCPQKNLNRLKQHWQAKELDIIMLTSASSVTHLFDLQADQSATGEQQSADWLNQVTLLLGSERMKQALPKDYKGKVIIADDPSDETLTSILKGLDQRPLKNAPRI